MKLGSKYKPTFGNVAKDVGLTWANTATLGIAGQFYDEQDIQNPFLDKINEKVIPAYGQIAATVGGMILGVPELGNVVGGLQNVSNNQTADTLMNEPKLALGGTIQSYQGLPKHANGGVMVDQLGNPSAQSNAKGIAEVEGGEYSHNGYVFSNQLSEGKKQPTFAEQFKGLAKKYGYDFKNKKFKRDSDPITKGEFEQMANQLRNKQDALKLSKGLARVMPDGSVMDGAPMMAKGGTIPPYLLKEQNPYLVPEYNQPMVGSNILPDPNRPKVPGTQMSEYKMGINMDGKDYSIPTVVGGQYLGAEGAIDRFRATGESFKNTANPQSYSKFYDEVDKIGIMKLANGGGIPPKGSQQWYDNNYNTYQLEGINLNSMQSIPGYVKMPNAFTRSAAIPYPNEYTDINNLQQASSQILGQRGFIPNTQNVNAAISTQLGTNPGLNFTPTIGTLDTSEMSSMRPKGIPNNQVPENQSYKNNVSRRLFETQPVFDFGAGNVLKYPHSSVMSGGNYIGKTPNTVLQQTPMDTQATTDWVNSELNNIRNMPKAPYQTTPIQYNDSEFKIGNITDNLEGLPNVGNKTQSSFLGDLPTSAKVGMGVQALSGLANAAYAFSRKPNKATPQVYTPETVNYNPAVQAINEQAATARNMNLDLARRTGTLSGFMNVGRAGLSDINRQTGAAASNILAQEANINTQARNQAQLANLQERARVQELNFQEKDAIDSLRMNAIGNLGTLGSSMSRDVLAYQSEAEKAARLGSPNYKNITVNGVQKQGALSNRTTTKGLPVYILQDGEYVDSFGNVLTEKDLAALPSKK